MIDHYSSSVKLMKQQISKSISIIDKYDEWILFEENKKGKIASGFLADYIILDKNPMNESGESLKNINILETIKENKTVFKKVIN